MILAIFKAFIHLILNIYISQSHTYPFAFIRVLCVWMAQKKYSKRKITIWIT